MEDDLVDLMAALRGAEIAPARREELLARLGRDEEFLDAFVEQAGMLGMLKVVQSSEPRWLQLEQELGWEPSSRMTDEEFEDQWLRRVETIGPRRSPSRGRWGLAAIAAVVVVSLAGLWWSWSPRRGAHLADADRTSSPARSNGVAVVAKVDNAQWDGPDGQPIVEGSVLSPGRYQIRSGRAIASFISGVVVTIEGPADIDIVAVDRLFCRFGKLRARVPKGAEGFVIASPGSAVVDLGTEFALSVEGNGKAHVMVFEGTAEAVLLDASGSPRKTLIVHQDRAFDIDPATSQMVEAVASSAAFAPTPRMAIPPLVLDPAYSATVMKSRPVSYWRFESLSDGLAANEVPGGPPLRANGPVSLSPEHRGNRSVVFQPGAPEQFLATDRLWDLGPGPGRAVELWFLTESIRYSSLVGFYPPTEMVPPNQNSRYVHTFFVELTARDRQSLYRPGTARFLHRWPLDVTIGDNLFSDAFYTPWIWHHVLAQTSGDRMELYFDGELCRTTRIKPDNVTIACNLVVGRRSRNGSDFHDIRYFIGWLDELAIYDHPLSPDEVRRHFQMAGVRPPSH